MSLISVCIPAYEMHGEGSKFLKRSFDVLKEQTFKDFEVVVSDNSEDDAIKNLCREYENILNINFVRNPKKGMAQNTNEAIKIAQGEIIKILFLDDYLANENSLKEIVDNFKGEWLVTGCEHDSGDGYREKIHLPIFSKKIFFGINTIGSPSVLAIKNTKPISFDKKMTWLLDCDYYARLYKKYGNPTILNTVNVIIGTGEHQTTHHLKRIHRIAENIYLIKKIIKNTIKL